MERSLMTRSFRKNLIINKKLKKKKSKHFVILQIGLLKADFFFEIISKDADFYEAQLRPSKSITRIRVVINSQTQFASPWNNDICGRDESPLINE